MLISAEHRRCVMWFIYFWIFFRFFRLFAPPPYPPAPHPYAARKCPSWIGLKYKTKKSVEILFKNFKCIGSTIWKTLPHHTKSSKNLWNFNKTIKFWKWWKLSLFCLSKCFLNHKLSHPALACLTLAMVALVLGVKCVQGWNWRLLWFLYCYRILYTIFWDICCWLWTCNCLRGFYLFWFHRGFNSVYRYFSICFN